MYVHTYIDIDLRIGKRLSTGETIDKCLIAAQAGLKQRENAFVSRVLILHCFYIFLVYLSVNGGWSSFGPWSTCSASCGEGTTSRLRHCSNPSPQNGGKNCVGSAEEKTNCTERPCPGTL